MRPVYLLLKISLNYALRLFYRRHLVINKPKTFYNRTIYVSNHPNSFMDPMLLGSINRPVVHFMTRSDVFKWWLKPVLWSAHMLPIFRQLDGENTKEKNAETFDKCATQLKKRGNILIFGEGFTDDVPVRSLKPIKKGALRIGFGTLVANNWSFPVHVAALGVTYSDRNTIGSEFVVKNGSSICLNDYKESYLENPNKTIVDLTKELEINMQDCIVYVAQKDWFNFHELVMQFSRKGMNNEQYDASNSLEDRFIFAQQSANWVNEISANPSEEMLQLKQEMDTYSALLKRSKLSDKHIFLAQHPEQLNTSKELLFILLLFPFALIGLLHGTIPYLLAKKTTEKLFKRNVFWGSVKLLLGMILGTAFTIPLINLIFYAFDGNLFWYKFIYFFFVPLFCMAAYKWVQYFGRIREKNMLRSSNLNRFIEKRTAIIHELNRFLPTFNK